jgi:hypothetical protein
MVSHTARLYCTIVQPQIPTLIEISDQSWLRTTLQLGSIGVKPILVSVRVPSSGDLGGLDDLPDLVNLFFGQFDIGTADVFLEVLDLLGTATSTWLNIGQRTKFS